MGSAGWVSEHLAHHHRCHSGEHGEAQGREGGLILGRRDAGDHAGAEVGHGQLGGEGGALFHGEPRRCRQFAADLPRPLGGTGGSLLSVGFRFSPQLEDVGRGLPPLAHCGPTSRRPSSCSLRQKLLSSVPLYVPAGLE